MKIENKIIKIKSRLHRERPFFGALFEHVTLYEDNSIETVDIRPNKLLLYNKQYLNMLKDDELIATICHELMHPILFYKANARKLFCENSLNIAQDLVINDVLSSIQLKPYGSLEVINHAYKGLQISNINNKSWIDLYKEVETKLPNSNAKISPSIWQKSWNPIIKRVTTYIEVPKYLRKYLEKSRGKDV